MKVKKTYSEIIDDDSYFFKKITFIFVSLGFIGFIPIASGTFASFATVLLSSFIIFNFGFNLFVVFTVLVSIFGFYFTYKSQEYHPDEDPPYIVIDEFMGQALALIILFGLMYTVTLTNDYNGFKVLNTDYTSYFLYMKNMWIYYIVALFLFRLFDIFKPSIVGKIDRNIKGPMGIIFDDIAAGVLAGVLSYFVLIIIYRLFLASMFYNQLFY